MEFINLLIPDQEKKNIKHLINLLERASQSLGHSLESEVVGGVTSKPWPRKDIDIVCTILDLNGKLKGTRLDRANQQLNVLINITNEAISYDNKFSVDKIIRPYEDHQFSDPEILAFGGVIRLNSRNGVQIEIIGGLA